MLQISAYIDQCISCVPGIGKQKKERKISSANSNNKFSSKQQHPIANSSRFNNQAGNPVCNPAIPKTSTGKAEKEPDARKQ